MWLQGVRLQGAWVAGGVGGACLLGEQARTEPRVRTLALARVLQRRDVLVGRAGRQAAHLRLSWRRVP